MDLVIHLVIRFILYFI